MFATPRISTVCFIFSPEETPEPKGPLRAVSPHKDRRTGFPWMDTHSDHHVHTRFCNHAVGEMEEYVQAAIDKGLSRITFLEHMEEGISAPSATWLNDADFDRYFAEGERLKTVYGSQLKIRLGVECGFNEACAGTLLHRLSQRKWDEVGISCHFLKLDGDDLHLNLFSRKEINVRRALQHNSGTLFTRYLKALIMAASVLPGTMLCHLDGALRFVPEASLAKEHEALIATLLSIVKEKNMAVEINTSGIAIRGEAFPCKDILATVMEQKIPLVLSSDAHQPRDVGNYFSLFKHLLELSASPRPGFSS